MRGLARERLPARHLREVDESLAAPPELLGHVVERRHRAPDFASSRRLDLAGPVAGGKVGQARRQLLDGPADAVRDEHDRRQRHEPHDGHEQQQRERESAPQVA